jgi:drug/metabolite transporter (DMT)-like permease
MGAVVLNRLRITMALAFLAVALLATHGSPWPTWATRTQVGLLGASGLIGFVLGDNYYFRSLLILGPGRGAMLASLAPLFTALLGVPVLGETLGPTALLGMALTLAGLFWTLAERERLEHARILGSAMIGILAGVLGALGQAGGFVISKLALREGLDPLSATVVRVAAATAVVWVVALAGGETARSLQALRNRTAALNMVGGAFCGPFLGVTLSLFALKHTEAGIAASITAFYPILTLLISSRFHAERVTARTLVGAIVSITGILVLFLR